MSNDTKPLSPRHAHFVLEYLKDGNATQVHIRAGNARRVTDCISTAADGRLRIDLEKPDQAQRAGTHSKPEQRAGTHSKPEQRAGTHSKPEQRAGTHSKPEQHLGTHSKPEQQQVRIKLGRAGVLDSVPVVRLMSG